MSARGYEKILEVCRRVESEGEWKSAITTPGSIHLKGHIYSNRQETVHVTIHITMATTIMEALNRIAPSIEVTIKLRGQDLVKGETVLIDSFWALVEKVEAIAELIDEYELKTKTDETENK